MKKHLLFTLLCAVCFLAATGCQGNTSKPENSTNTQIKKEEQPKIDWDVNTSTATVTIDNWKYSLARDNSKKTVRIPKVEYVGNPDEEELQIVIPSTIDGMKVTGIGQSDKDRDELYEFPDSHDSLFGVTLDMEEMSVTGENELTKKITGISLPDSIETIECGTFSGLTGLKEIELPDDLTTIGSFAFYSCTKLEKVVISDHLAAFSPYIFEGCDKLSEIQISADNPNFYEQDGFIITKSDKKLIYALPTKEQMDIPDGVKTFGEEALKYSMAKTIQIPASVTHIEKEALSAPGVSSIDVNEDNPAIAKDGYCLYGKKDKELIAVQCVDNRLEISPEVLRIDENAMSTGVNQRVKRVIIGENVKELVGAWMDFEPLEYRTKKYEFKGTVPPKITGVPSHDGAIPSFCTIYVPARAEKEYKKWIEKYGEGLNKLAMPPVHSSKY